MNNYIMALFASGTTNFDYAGMGILKDAYSAVATEAAASNGNITYTMEMTYPVNGYLADKLVEGNLIKAQVSKTPGDYMVFEINETIKSDDTTITVYCDAYANRILRMSFDNGGKFGSFNNVQAALNAARQQMNGIQSDFTLKSGIGTKLNMSGVSSKNTVPTTYQDFNAYLDAIMDKVQGNVRFGINSIQIVSDRGRDITETVLRDDKNTNGISIKVDTSNIVNRIIPVLPVLDKDGNVTQETKVGHIVTSSVAFKFINFYAGQVVAVDTQDLADSYFNRTHCDRPTTTATVQTSMLDEDLTDIRLFDRVQVYSSKIGYQAKLRVSERDFDILAGAVSEFKLGSSSVTVFNSQANTINAINSAIELSQHAALTADGKNAVYYEGGNPNDPKENDLWFHTVDGISQMDQYVNGNWTTIVSDSFGEQIRQKVEKVRAEAYAAVDKAEEASSNAKSTADKFDDTNQKAEQALGNAISAEASASSAVAKAESAASEFGRVDQKADSAFSNAMSAQNAASSAVSQASSAEADSKDAKQIAGAVNQSYKMLTDGSTMTIAELQSGLAVKLTKTDLNGYATQDWSQNQIKLTADGINGTISSVKNTVDSHTTSINDLKADSNGFRDQFTTVTNTLGKQTTDISTLQVSSKELVSNFDSLSTANGKNEHNISQLQQDSKGFSSTLETVQTQVQNSAVGTNLLANTADNGVGPVSIQGDNSGAICSPSMTRNSSYIEMTNAAVGDEMYYRFCNTDSSMHNLKPGQTYTIQGEVYVSKGSVHFRSQYQANGGWVDYSGCQSGDLATNTSGFVKVNYTFTIPVNATAMYISWQVYGYDSTTVFRFRRTKLEIGSNATDYSTNPADNATVTAVSKLSQTVDGMKYDISKKIEGKDLNGYATETFLKQNIQVAVDGINGTISSVKNTVNEHTTNIHDIQADSKEFKSQFTTYKDTVDRHSKDIGTLQSDSKRFSSNFDSWDTDNKTIQHDIGELQHSSKDFSSTLIKVKDSLSTIGTPNLVSAYNWRTAAEGGGSPVTTVTHHFYNGLQPLYVINNQTSNENYAYSPRFNLKPNTTYVVSLIGFEDVHVSNSDVFVLARKAGETASFTIAYNTIPGAVFPSDKAQRVASSSFTTGDNVNSGYMRIDNNGSKDGNNGGLFFTEVKLQEGTIATPYTSAQEDLATVTAVSSISQTIDKIQGTIINKADQSQITQLADQITSTVGQISGVNLIPNSDFSQGSQYWHLSDKAYIADHSWNYTDGALVLDHSDTRKDTTIDIIVKPNSYYTFSCNMYGTMHVFLVPMKDTTGNWIPVDDDYQDNFHILTGTDERTPRQSFTLTRTSGQTRRLRLILRATAGTTRSTLTKFQLEEGKVAHAWGPSTNGLATFSQITQLKDDISLRVEKKGVINAVNVSSEGIQIYGNKLHITATTYIDDAIIKSAMIESLQADKIRTGTLDADKVDVIHLNAGNITAGVINGPNLTINLDNGEILFQKGAIRSTNGNLNIDIDSGKMGVINSEGNGFRFEDGNLYLTDNTWVDAFQSKPDYGSITYKPSLFSNVNGMQINGTEGIAVTAGDYDSYNYFIFQRQPNSGAALALNDNTAFLNARELTRLEGGTTYTEGVLKPNGARASIVVGGANGATGKSATGKYGWYNFQEPSDAGPDLFMKGSSITLQGGTDNVADLTLHKDATGGLIQSAAIYKRTYSSGDKVTITSYGTLGRITSARKYKIADTTALDVISKAKRVLDIKPAEWYDKAEMESIADAETKGIEAPGEAKIEKHYGFIADDFDEAGLNEVVIYRDGEVDSLEYDRISMYHNVILTDHEKRIAKLEAELKQLKGEI